MRVRICVLFLAVLLGLLALDAQEPPAQRQGAQTGESLREFLGLGQAPDREAAKRGEPLYRENCAACHGQNARGAQGPNLVRSTLVLHDDKGEDLAQVVKNGRAQAGMPMFPNLSPAQVRDISEFIHLQIELAANRGTYRQTYAETRKLARGDSAHGKILFQQLCASCHSAEGDLARIGSKAPDAPAMLARIAWPRPSKPQIATVHLKDGNTLKGSLLEMSDFDVVLKDEEGGYHSWSRREVQVDVADPLAGHRSLLPKYSDSDLHDLVAYLVSLR